MEADTLIQYLEWDSNFFGIKIAKVLPNRLTRKEMEWIKDFCIEHSIDCLYFLADPNDEATCRLAEAQRFHLVDIRITFEKVLDGSIRDPAEIAHPSIRIAAEEDIPNLRSLVKPIQFDTRFYLDPSFPNSLSDQLYEIWIENSVRNKEQVVFVCENEIKQIIGFITCSVGETGVGQIGLIGINVEQQSKGYGKRLLEQAIHWFCGKGTNQVIVVTQGRNVKSQRLYQRAGFLTKSVYLWYHRWFRDHE